VRGGGPVLDDPVGRPMSAEVVNGRPIAGQRTYALKVAVPEYALFAVRVGMPVILPLFQEIQRIVLRARIVPGGFGVPLRWVRKAETGGVGDGGKVPVTPRPLSGA
jgi:hypothetical protein